MYKKYLEERRPGSSVFISEWGFATYHIRPFQNQKECYIEDIYVDKAHRNSHVASYMADEIIKIAKEQNCDFVSGSVVPSTKNSTASLKVLLA